MMTTAEMTQRLNAMRSEAQKLSRAVDASRMDAVKRGRLTAALSRLEHECDRALCITDTRREPPIPDDVAA